MTKIQKLRVRTRELARFLRVLLRQKDYRWGGDYVPATHAVRGEAPGISVSSTLPSRMLKRQVHALSRPEAFCFALALYLPALWELHEQHVLYPNPKQHPLASHPAYSNQIWPSSSGTYAIAKQLGFAEAHPMVWKPNQTVNPHRAELSELIEPQEDGKWLPSAYQGDALLYLYDQEGPYLLSWDIKSKAGEHGRPGGEMIDQMRPGAKKKAAVREAIYVEYMHELGIRIVRISPEDIPVGVRENLYYMCKCHTQPIALPPGMQTELRFEFQLALEKTGELPLSIINRIVRTDQQFIAAKNLMYQAIWNRELRVELGHPIVIDSPLIPESSDLLVTHHHLFKR